MTATALQRALSELNAEQREAALVRRHCLVTACPGSGKTKVLSVKSALLLSEPEQRVCMVTFSRAGALELKARSVALLNNPADGKRLAAGTFHGLCSRMLAKHGGVNLKALMSDAEQWQYATRAAQAVGLDDLAAAEAMAVVDYVRTSDRHINHGRAERGLADAYIEILRRNGKIDFTDLVLDTLAGLEGGQIPPIPVQWMLVDEFQDTDALQYRWIAAHAAAGTTITVVGDDDQAIFGWRHGLGYVGMMQFAKDQDATQIVLGQNYRCHAEILDAANRLIVNNSPDRVAKTLIAAKGSGGQVHVMPEFDAAGEAKAVAAALSDFAAATYSAAVLSRTNRHLLCIETELVARDIAYSISRSSSLFAAIETHIYMDLLECVATGSTKGVDQALAWAGTQAQDLQTLHHKFGNKLIVGSKADFASLKLDADSEKRWKIFVQTMLAQQARCSDGEVRINALLEGVRSWMEENNPAPFLEKGVENLEAIHTLFVNTVGDLRARLKRIRDRQRSSAKPSDQRAVVLTTMHKSKGLEWDRVFIIRAEADVCPSKTSMDIQEERRLFYVAMTRARERLTISFTHKRAIMSPFVSEAKIILDAAGAHR